MVSTILMDLAVLLAAAVVMVPLFQTLRLGAVPGFLIAGVLVGPSALGLIDNVDGISHFAEIGVVLLLFVIGIELKPSRLWRMRRMVFGLGSLQVIGTGILLSLVSYFVFDNPKNASILIGPALALSSTAIVLQLLVEKRMLTTGFGRTAFSILLLQDLAVVPLLTLVSLLAMPDLSLGPEIGLALVESIVIVILVIVVGRFLLHPILHRVARTGSAEVFTASAVLIVLGTALISEHIGLSMAMGAFLAGLLISDSAYRHQVMAEIQPFRGLLLGLFFMSMGMSLDLNYFFANPLVSLGYVVVLMLIKIAVLWPMALAFGVGKRTSVGVALLLAQSGEFALVLFALAFQAELLAHDLFQQLLLVVLISMVVTPALANLAQRFMDRPRRVVAGEEPTAAPIVIAGFGRVGHRIGAILAIARQPYVALDLDAALVERERANGHPVFFGDARQPEVLRAAGAKDASMIIVTLNDVEATERVVSALRGTYPNITIVARGHSLNQCRKLRRLGATDAVSENVEASLEMARLALSGAGVEEQRCTSIVDEFRTTYHEQINEVIQDR